MAEGINVRFSGTLQQFIHDRVDGSGLYSSASEYIRDLVRRDLEREEERRWDGLHAELAKGLAAEETAFVPLNAATLLQKAKARIDGDAD
jgi:antitoxin ParD1/3/4